MRFGIACLVLWLGCAETQEVTFEQPLIPLSGRRPHGMRNCPATVTGAHTEVTRTPDGVQLTITADTEDGRAEILTRTRTRLRQGVRRGAVPPHSTLGGGPEWIGYCPLILTGTAVSYVERPRGVRIDIRARDPIEAAKLQARVESRASALGLATPVARAHASPRRIAVR